MESALAPGKPIKEVPPFAMKTAELESGTPVLQLPGTNQSPKDPFVQLSEAMIPFSELKKSSAARVAPPTIFVLRIKHLSRRAVLRVRARPGGKKARCFAIAPDKLPFAGNTTKRQMIKALSKGK